MDFGRIAQGVKTFCATGKKMNNSTGVKTSKTTGGSIGYQKEWNSD
tara:strand:- start:1746 stop:1883 length:138 start_codon:yes stop_codon:yes gene_type:complete